MSGGRTDEDELEDMILASLQDKEERHSKVAGARVRVTVKDDQDPFGPRVVVAIGSAILSFSPCQHDVRESVDKFVKRYKEKMAEGVLES